MKKLKTIVLGFVIFNCLSLVALAQCDPSMTINGQTCGFTGVYNGYCWYSCPNGSGGFKPKGHGEEDPPIDEGPVF